MEDVQRPSSTSVKRKPFGKAGQKKIILRVFQSAKRSPAFKRRVATYVSDYTGALKASIYRILREEKVYGEVQPPKVKTGRKKIEIDEYAKYAISRTVHTFFL